MGSVSKVYFTKNITPEQVVKMYDTLGKKLTGNTAYEGERNSTEKHVKLIKKHGWNDFFVVDLMDAEGPDVTLPISHPNHLKNDIVGKNLLNYDSMLVLSHFKGHPMGGYGGALKQLSIGCASTAGKVNIHSGGKYTKNITSFH